MYFSAVIFGIAIIAEALGLGGIPAKALEIENFLLVGLLLAFLGLLLRRNMRR
jgi:uncharacterized membrane protein YtjA (UPF0391 family)